MVTLKALTAITFLGVAAVLMSFFWWVILLAIPVGIVLSFPLILYFMTRQASESAAEPIHLLQPPEKRKRSPELSMKMVEDDGGTKIYRWPDNVIEESSAMGAE